MKKTLKRIFLSVCIVAMLLGSFTAAAFADGDYIKYTMKGGDTVYGVCKQQGIDFNSNRNWITAVNNITNYNNIKVGTVIILPTFDTSKDPTRANQVAAALGKNSSVSTGGTAAPAVTVTTAAPVAAAGDTIVSYLVNHVMQPGETVGAVCNALGVNFAANADKIMKLSGITNWNKIPVGKVVVIPSASAPAGSNYTAIVAHRVQAGETVGSICNNYGVNFAKTQAQLKALNSTDNLNVIKAGQIFYIPVSGAVVSTTTVTPTGGGTTTPTTPTSGGSTTQPETNPGSSMTSQTGAHGSFKLQVDGKDVTTASAGQTVKIVASPDAGYVVNTVTVLKDNGKVAVPVQGMSFTMPNSPITVNVTFKKA